MSSYINLMTIISCPSNNRLCSTPFIPSPERDEITERKGRERNRTFNIKPHIFLYPVLRLCQGVFYTIPRALILTPCCKLDTSCYQGLENILANAFMKLTETRTNFGPLVEVSPSGSLQQQIASASRRLTAGMRHASGHLHPAWPVAMVTARHQVRTLEQHSSTTDHRSLLRVITHNNITVSQFERIGFVF